MRLETASVASHWPTAQGFGRIARRNRRRNSPSSNGLVLKSRILCAWHIRLTLLGVGACSVVAPAVDASFLLVSRYPIFKLKREETAMSEYPSVGQISVKWDVLLGYSVGLVLIVLILLLTLT